jgi:hypothetical protein
MSAFTLTIDTSNAAFGPTPADRGAEIARLLRALADDMADNEGGYSARLFDINGNNCGTAEIGCFDFAAHGYPDGEA